jgi:hypothetical protein
MLPVNRLERGRGRSRVGGRGGWCAAGMVELRSRDGGYARRPRVQHADQWRRRSTCLGSPPCIPAGDLAGVPALQIPLLHRISHFAFLKRRTSTLSSSTVVTPPLEPARARQEQGRVFLLSPASLVGARGRRILTGETSSPLLAPLLSGAALPLGEIYAAISTLYFRGKLEYARRFGRSGAGPAALVITPDRGLVEADQPVTLEELRRFAATVIDPEEPRYVEALLLSAEEAHRSLGESCEVVLLGSIATRKYVEPLLGVFAARLLVPEAFIGRGDMSRGGLLLRAVAEGRELQYVAVRNAARRGHRPPRLDPASCGRPRGSRD